MIVNNKFNKDLIMQTGAGKRPASAKDAVPANFTANLNAADDTAMKTPGGKNADLWEPMDWDSLDTVVVSDEAKKSAVDWQSKLEEMRDKMRELREGLQRAREAGEGAAEAWKEKIKCMQIAMRIMSGNKVPEEDHRFLQEKDPELYGKAITMRMEKVDPKEHDRLSEDEEEDGIAGSPESVSIESSGADEPAADGDVSTEEGS